MLILYRPVSTNRLGERKQGVGSLCLNRSRGSAQDRFGTARGTLTCNALTTDVAPWNRDRFTSAVCRLYVQVRDGPHYLVAGYLEVGGELVNFGSAPAPSCLMSLPAYFRKRVRLQRPVWYIPSDLRA